MKIKHTYMQNFQNENQTKIIIKFISMDTNYYKNIKLQRTITEHIQFNKKFSDTMNVSMHLFMKSTNFLNSITKYMKKYTKIS